MNTGKIILSVIIIIIFAANTHAQVTQQWLATHNGPGNSFDFATLMALDPQGNVFTAGTSNGGSSGFDILVCKFSAAGVFQWSKVITGPGNRNDNVQGLKADENGNVYVAGEILTASGQSEITIVKYNTNGHEIWRSAYNGPGSGPDSPRDMAIDNMGNVYITGYHTGANGFYDAFAAKYDSSGARQWATGIVSTGLSSQGNSITVDGAGNNIYFTGFYFYDMSNSRVIYTVKLNSAGDTIWTRRENGSSGLIDVGVDVITDNNGNVIVAASTQNTGSRDDITVIKYNPAGARQWMAVNNLSGQNDNIWHIECDAAGNIYGGCKKGHSVSNDFAVQKYSPAGTIEWTQVYNGGGNDALTDLLVHNGFIYVTGLTAAAGQGDNAVTLKYNSDGVKLWEKVYSNPDNGNDQGRAMEIDNNGNVIVAGNSYDSTTNLDVMVIKYSQDMMTGISGNEAAEKYELLQNYPNPFNPATSIKFFIPSGGNVLLKVYDVSGKQVAELVNGFKHKGSYTVSFDASHLSSGAYFYMLEAGGFKETKKMLLLR
jgi:uncharacterized delta-60 repeat protein